MVWNVWTVSIRVCGVKVISATVRQDAVGWAEEQELQRARAAGGSLPHTHSQDEGTRAQAQAGAAAVDSALDLATLEAWYATKSHVRDARRVARAAMRRGIDVEEASDIREWLDKRDGCSTSEPDAKELSDAERNWLANRTAG